MERIGKAHGCRVHALELAQEAPAFVQPGHGAILGLHEPPEHAVGEFENLSGIRCDRIASGDFFILAGLERGIRDFRDLMAEQIEFALHGGLAAGEFVPFGDGSV